MNLSLLYINEDSIVYDELVYPLNEIKVISLVINDNNTKRVCEINGCVCYIEPTIIINNDNRDYNNEISFSNNKIVVSPSYFKSFQIDDDHIDYISHYNQYFIINGKLYESEWLYTSNDDYDITANDYIYNMKFFIAIHGDTLIIGEYGYNGYDILQGTLYATRKLRDKIKSKMGIDVNIYDVYKKSGKIMFTINLNDYVDYGDYNWISCSYVIPINFDELINVNMNKLTNYKCTLWNY